MVSGIAIGVHDSLVLHIIEAREEREFHVGDIKLPGVQRRDGIGATKDGIVHPQAVLEEQRNQTNRERIVALVVLAREALRDGTGVTFEEQRFQIQIKFQIAFVLGIATPKNSQREN